jgi:phage/plasmid-like protein (TIGR03299 family)
MSHEIDITTGRAAVFVTGEPAWHGLGTVIDTAATSRDAIGLAGLAWTVEQWPIQTTDPGTLTAIDAPDHVANVRTDTHAVLGVVGKRYHVFQNAEAFDFMDAIVGDRLAMFETAGSLRGGRRIWMLARIPTEYRAGPDDLIKPYVLLVNSHDGSTALRMIPTTVRVVCQNTLNLALSHSARGEGIAIPHRPSLDQRVHEARRRLGIVAARFDAFDEELHAMLDTPLVTGQVEAYFMGLVPTPVTDRQRQSRDRMLDQLRANFEDDTNALPGVAGTAWAVYNAVSEFADHQRNFRGKSEQARAENRLSSVWFGSSHRLKQQAYDAALALAH